MLNSESDNYQLEHKEKLIIEDLYQDGVLIGHKKTIRQNSGYYREIFYNSENQIMSDKKYSATGHLISGKIYVNGKIAQYIETDTDSAGYRHEIVIDSDYKAVSHSKFDKFGRYAGGIIYENHKIIGQKELKYLENGDIIETVRDEKYKIVLERKIIANRNNFDKTVPTTNSVIIEQHEIKIDNDGKQHEIVYDANNQIISDKELPLISKPVPRAIVCTNKEQINTQKMSLKDKFATILSKILHLQR